MSESSNRHSNFREMAKKKFSELVHKTPKGPAVCTSASNQSNPFTNLPTEILHIILSYLSDGDKVALASTCHCLYDTVAKKFLYRTVEIRDKISLYKFRKTITKNTQLAENVREITFIRPTIENANQMNIGRLGYSYNAPTEGPQEPYAELLVTTIERLPNVVEINIKELSPRFEFSPAFSYLKRNAFGESNQGRRRSSFNQSKKFIVSIFQSSQPNKQGPESAISDDEEDEPLISTGVETLSFSSEEGWNIPLRPNLLWPFGYVKQLRLESMVIDSESLKKDKNLPMVNHTPKSSSTSRKVTEDSVRKLSSPVQILTLDSCTVTNSGRKFISSYFREVIELRLERLRTPFDLSLIHHFYEARKLDMDMGSSIFTHGQGSDGSVHEQNVIYGSDLVSSNVGYEGVIGSAGSAFQSAIRRGVYGNVERFDGSRLVTELPRNTMLTYFTIQEFSGDSTSNTSYRLPNISPLILEAQLYRNAEALQPLLASIKHARSLKSITLRNVSFISRELMLGMDPFVDSNGDENESSEASHQENIEKIAEFMAEGQGFSGPGSSMRIALEGKNVVLYYKDGGVTICNDLSKEALSVILSGYTDSYQRKIKSCAKIFTTFIKNLAGFEEVTFHLSSKPPVFRRLPKSASEAMKEETDPIAQFRREFGEKLQVVSNEQRTISHRINLSLPRSQFEWDYLFRDLISQEEHSTMYETPPSTVIKIIDCEGNLLYKH